MTTQARTFKVVLNMLSPGVGIFFPGVGYNDYLRSRSQSLVHKFVKLRISQPKHDIAGNQGQK